MAEEISPRLAILWGLTVVLAFVVGIGIGGQGSQNTASYPPQPASSTTSRPVQAAPQAPQYKPFEMSTAKILREWRGNGNKQTETIQIDQREWAISWNSQPNSDYGMFAVVTYKNGQYDKLVVNTLGATRDTTIMHNGTGRFYLDITASQPWGLQVLSN